jgi:hypothetical protein
VRFKQSRAFFEKKEPKKLLLVFRRGVATAPLEQKFFAELFFKKATSSFSELSL